MEKKSRRNFLKWTGLGLASGSLVSKGYSFRGYLPWKKDDTPFNLGMASYTFREFSLENTLAMTTRLGLELIAFKSFHLALDSTEEEIRAVAAKVKAASLNLYGCGVVYMKNSQEVGQSFKYAQTAGMEIIIGVPDHDLLDLVQQKVKEFDIKLAIHNHGPGDKVYPTP
ncbi:MAG: sugar phosphate isomerase/epimerase, partial [Candidatus Aminicenantes bacterium]|nr:sugar phosphate isomerase/epimerase [Candidatus Aminicenantes bacterium]